MKRRGKSWLACTWIIPNGRVQPYEKSLRTTLESSAQQRASSLRATTGALTESK